MPLIEFRSAVSGLWYRNPKAAGTVDAVRLFTGAELPFLYELPSNAEEPVVSAQQPPAGQVTVDQAMKEVGEWCWENNMRQPDVMHKLRERITALASAPRTNEDAGKEGLGVPGAEPPVGPMLQVLAEDGSGLSANVPHANTWIPVDHQLPPANTEVLVALEDCSIPSVGQYTQIRRTKGMGWLLPQECHADGAVTHWMPLPDAPPTK